MAHMRLMPACLVALAICLGADAHARPDRSQIDAIFPDYARPGQPGCAVGLFEGGRIVMMRGYGAANLDWNEAFTVDTVFELGSVSKQFAALAILVLEKEGRLSRSDSVRKHLPRLPARFEPVTLDHLMRHISGVPDYITLARLSQAPGSEELTRRSALELVEKAPFLYAPGTDFAYSNTGYLLLADVVERVSGAPFASFLETRLFRPLGMSDTRVMDGARPSPRRAAFYRIDETGAPRAHEWEGRDTPGAWGVRSTLRDLARYNAALTSGESMLAPLRNGMEAETRLNSGERVTYGAGLFIGAYRGLRFTRHGGRNNIDFMQFPETGRAIALLCNRADADAELRSDAVADVFMADRLEPAAPHAAAAQYPQLIGDYTTADGERASIRNEGGRLVLADWGWPRPLRVLGPNLLAADVSTDDIRVRVEEGANGAAALIVSMQSSRDRVFSKYAPAEYPARALAAFAGRYLSDALEAVYTIRIENGSALLVMPDRSERPLEPMIPDLFAAGGGLRVRFRRDAWGAVIGLGVATERTPELAFRRLDTDGN